METETPETDRELHAVQYGTSRFSFPEHARRMERERNDARKELLALVAACNEYGASASISHPRYTRQLSAVRKFLENVKLSDPPCCAGSGKISTPLPPGTPDAGNDETGESRSSEGSIPSAAPSPCSAGLCDMLGCREHATGDVQIGAEYIPLCELHRQSEMDRLTPKWRPIELP